jgi:hypothetical protein
MAKLTWPKAGELKAMIPLLFPDNSTMHVAVQFGSMENNLLFCSILKLMFTNGKIIVYKFMIQFYSYLYLCQSYS